jgi:DNA invertase Pin-like site-specific DNA recombinase
MCRAHRAALIVAKLDRLARNAHFLLLIVEGSGEAGVVFCDLPTVPAGPLGKFFVSLLASVAELEAGLISQRTKAALAEAKKRGVKLGNPRPRGRRRVDQIRGEGAETLTAIAAELDRMGVPTSSGQGRWHAATVTRVIAAGRPAGRSDARSRANATRDAHPKV